LQCFNRIPEIYEEANCHRSEALGILTSLVIIDIIDQYISKISKEFQYPYQIRLICDNESVVRTINKMKNNKLTLKQQYSPNIDVLRAIIVKLITLKIKKCNVSIIHIKGHQDKQKKTLSKDEIMNVEADRLATLGLNKKNIKSILLPADRCQILIDNKQVCSKHTKTLRENYHSRNMYQYLQEKYKWSDKTLNNIWWEAHGKALLLLTEGKLAIIQKFNHEHISCNYRESKFYSNRSPYCRVCPLRIEDTDHIVKCMGDSANQKIRNRYFMKIHAIMTNMGTNDTTIRVIIHNLRSWIDESVGPSMAVIAPDASVHLIEAFEDQQRIGWGQWFRGRISKKWGELYNSDIESGNVKIQRPTALRWGKTIVLETMNFIVELWLTRNKREHDSNTDPVTRKNDKLIENILNEREKILEHNPSVWSEIAMHELKTLRQDNLRMVLAQIKMHTKKQE
jgi:hypothetical protein